jgi:hypothetical protein
MHAERELDRELEMMRQMSDNLKRTKIDMFRMKKEKNFTAKKSI